MATKGKLVIFVKKVAANASPMAAPSRTLGISARKKWISKMNEAPKQRAESMSFPIE